MGTRVTRWWGQSNLHQEIASFQDGLAGTFEKLIQSNPTVAVGPCDAALGTKN
jgi:hypothetical protein